MKARIVKIVSKEYTLMDEEGNTFDSILTGKIRKQRVPVTGDIVECKESHGRYVIDHGGIGEYGESGRVGAEMGYPASKGNECTGPNARWSASFRGDG